MTEFYRSPQSGFIRTFELLETTMRDPSKEFVVLDHEAMPGTHRAGEAEYGHDPKIPTFTVVEKDIDPNTAEATPQLYQRPYRQWRTPGSGVEPIVRRPLDERTRTLWGHSQRIPMRGGSEDTRLWLAATFLEKAKRPKTLRTP